MNFNPIEHIIFDAIAGSRLYGTNTPDSDFNRRGVCLPPLSVLVDPFHGFEQKDSGFEEEDRVIYDLGKWMKLCSDGNPNIIELLFIPNEFVVYKTQVWDFILENKDSFLSKRVMYTFLGYAVSQLKKLELHREWFINPPVHKPSRAEFGLFQTPVISESYLQNALSLKSEFFKDDVLYEIVAEKKYRDAKKKWDNYQAWLHGRNPARREMEERFGYDGKLAMHLFRLLSEGKELLLTGNITFPLPNATALLKIKEGFYSYENIMEIAKELREEFESLYDKSCLPNKPNVNALKNMYFEIVKGELLHD